MAQLSRVLTWSGFLHTTLDLSPCPGQHRRQVIQSELVELATHQIGYGEHDFGSFEFNGERVFWKIDYRQRGTQFGAEDPSDSGGTCRMITIMLAEEY